MASAPSSGPQRVVLITGASSGIGRATAIEFARAGRVTLLLLARREAELEQTRAQAMACAGDGVEFRLVPCDLLDRTALGQLLARLRDELDALHVLVNNAGAGSSTTFEDEAALDDIDRMIELNLRAPIALVQGLLPLLVGSGGTIINVSSVAGLLGTPDSAVYSATKWGLTGFTEALRARLAPFGVRVVCVQPGPVPTPGWPHAGLAGRPIVGRLMASSVDVIARTIVRAAAGRGGVAPVRPRTYAAIPLLRGLAPWLLRWLIERASRTGMMGASTGREQQAAPR